MRSAALALIGALALVTAAPQASAQTPADKADARCLLVLQLAARDPKNKEGVAQGTFFYLGRLTARNLSGKLEPMLLAEGKAITTSAQAQAELTRCGAELTARGGELRTVFGNLQKAAAAQAASAPKPAPPPSK